MDRLNKSKARLSFALSKTIKKKLEMIANQEGLSTSALLCKIVVDYIRKNYKEIYKMEVEIDEPEIKKNNKGWW